MFKFLFVPPMTEAARAAQQAANQELLRACWCGTVNNVKAALQNGANLVAVNADAATGLMLACRRGDWTLPCRS